MAVDFEAEANGPVVVSDSELATIAELANTQLELEAGVEAAELALKDAKERLRKVRTELLPAAMASAGVSEFTLADGTKVSVKPDVEASVAEVNKARAYTWLRDNGHGSIIKNEVKLAFGMGEEDRAKALVTYLQEQGLDFDQKQAIHPGTLKAWAKEELAKGTPLADVGFTVFELKVAKVKPAR